ncbi:MAG TPA: hypothetical protein VFE15_14950 [Marmoricola sp.]|nr:hypothetical protein [Marmoricola sp.]
MATDLPPPDESAARRAGVDWIPLYMITLMLAAFLLVIAAVGDSTGDRHQRRDPCARSRGACGWYAYPPGSPPPRGRRPSAPSSTAPTDPPPSDSLPDYPSSLPDGQTTIFTPGRVLVAYYGTAGTGSLGVLGEASPDRIMPRLLKAAAPFARGGRTVQPVFELIATVVHAHPGPHGTYSSDIPRAEVSAYIEAAHRHGALVILDLQTGRADFLSVAKRWAWALKDPWVGLALDPEWRMGPHQVPAHVIGSVSAAEVNRTSLWLDQLTAADRLPQKVFMLHEFRTSMIRNIARIQPRAHLAMVQHVDGFGPPGEKLSTFHAVADPAQFVLGFKLFYHQDVPRMTPARVLAIRPKVSFVSFQ